MIIMENYSIILSTPATSWQHSNQDNRNTVLLHVIFHVVLNQETKISHHFSILPDSTAL